MTQFLPKYLTSYVNTPFWWNFSRFELIQTTFIFIISPKTDIYSGYAFLLFLALKWTYVGQSDKHIGWATSIDGLCVIVLHALISKIENSVLLSPPIPFFFPSSRWKSVNIYRLARLGRNFDDYPGFQPKTTFMYYFAHDCR